MKTYGRMEVEFHIFLKSAFLGLFTKGKSPSRPLVGGLSRIQASVKAIFM
jgi:hypothetical protein